MTSLLVFEEPTAYGGQVVNQDGLWKKVIGDLFEDFLLFFATRTFSGDSGSEERNNLCGSNCKSAIEKWRRAMDLGAY